MSRGFYHSSNLYTLDNPWGDQVGFAITFYVCTQDAGLCKASVSTLRPCRFDLCLESLLTLVICLQGVSPSQVIILICQHLVQGSTLTRFRFFRILATQCTRGVYQHVACAYFHMLFTQWYHILAHQPYVMNIVVPLLVLYQFQGLCIVLVLYQPVLVVTFIYPFFTFLESYGIQDNGTSVSLSNLPGESLNGPRPISF